MQLEPSYTSGGILNGVAALEMSLTVPQQVIHIVTI